MSTSDSGSTDTWVVAAQRGDRLALAKLLAVCHPQLRAHTEARIDAAVRARFDPDDILQEVYFDVARQIERFEDRGSGSFLSWLRAILDHKLVDAQRAAHCQVRDVDREAAVGGCASDSYWNLLDDIYAESGTPSRIVRRQEALAALLSCVSGLTVTQREVVRLRYLEGLAVGEVATRLGRSEDAVVALSQRALAALRRSMDRLGEFTRGA